MNCPKNLIPTFQNKGFLNPNLTMVCCIRESNLQGAKQVHDWECVVVDRARDCNDEATNPFANQVVYNSLLSSKLRED